MSFEEEDMAEAFTMFAKFGNALEVLEEDDMKSMLYAIGMYGLYGKEVELPPLLKALFLSFRDDIDNSKASRRNGGKGGRPPRVSDNEKPLVSENEKPPVSETEKPAVSENENPSLYKPIQANTSQSNTDQSKPKGKRRAAFVPPTPEEVEEFSRSVSKPISGEGFCNYYAAQGWKLANGNPMKDWHAAVHNWWSRNRPKEVPDASVYDNLW